MPIRTRLASSTDVLAMARCRLSDPGAGPADPRMDAYFRGEHHPRQALMPRAGYVAIAAEEIIGYIAGHLTERYGCHGEVQYLFVTPAYRRAGVGRGLMRALAEWFVDRRAPHVCVDVNQDSPGARPFYVSVGAVDLRPHWMHWQDISVVLRERGAISC